MCSYSYDLSTGRYTCYLFDASVTSPDQTLRIDGRHLPDHTDEHVQALVPVSSARIDFLNGDIMEKFVNLQSLIFFFFQPIHGISENAFDSCRQLRELDFGSLNMTTLPNGLLKNCHNLRNFDVRSLTLSSIPGDLFGTIQSLENFRITASRLETLPSSIFEFSFNLRSVNLENNAFSNLDRNLLRNSKILETVILSSNQIRDPNVIYNLLNGLTSLRRIELLNSGVPTIDFNFFNQFQWLHTLIISTFDLLNNLAWNRLPSSLRILRVFSIGEF